MTNKESRMGGPSETKLVLILVGAATAFAIVVAIVSYGVGYVGGLANAGGGSDYIKGYEKGIRDSEESCRTTLRVTLRKFGCKCSDHIVAD
jgi:hypothetical protein